MKSAGWNNIAELIGIAAIVASLIFVGLQMKQADRIAQNDEDLTILSSVISINNVTNDHVDLWLRGVSGSELSDSEAFVFGNLVNNMNLGYFFGYRRASRMGRYEEAQTEIYDFAAMLHRNPGARRVWLETEEEFEDYRRRLSGGSSPYSFWKKEVLSNLKRLDQYQD